MFKLFKKNNKIVESYSVLLCDDNNANTAFGIYGTYETYEKLTMLLEWHGIKQKNRKLIMVIKLKTLG